MSVYVCTNTECMYTIGARISSFSMLPFMLEFLIERALTTASSLTPSVSIYPRKTSYYTFILSLSLTQTHLHFLNAKIYNMKGSGSTHDPYNIRITTQLARRVPATAVARSSKDRRRRHHRYATTARVSNVSVSLPRTTRRRRHAADDDDNYYDVVIVPKTTYPRGVRHSRIVDIYV